VPFDLSEVLFVCTANFVQNIPGPLLDRMEVVEFAGYTEREKVEIARSYLVPRQLEESGLSPEQLSFDESGLRALVSQYTRESGVRQLERQVGAVARKLARRIAAGETSPTVATPEVVRDLLGRPRVHPEQAALADEVGLATGMYYTPVGGDIMFVEAAVRKLSRPRTMPREDDQEFESVGGIGNVSLILTGQLGDVMKESARAALTYAVTHVEDLPEFVDRGDLGALEVHVHVPAGAIPKDGPSAGVAMATAIASALSGRPVRRDLAMTGEITLRGRVLPIGGVKEKVLGAHRAGIKRVILPIQNEPDLEDIPDEIRDSLQIELVRTLDEVLECALVPSGEAVPSHI
jgi:ATP-dependent Lon protease